MLPHRTIVLVALLGAAACSDGTGSAAALERDKPLDSLSESDSQALCAELDALTGDDAEYVRGSCSVLGFSLAASGLQACEEARDECIADFPSPCTPNMPGTGDAIECPDATAGALLDCWSAFIARSRERYASVRCEDPSSSLTVAEALAEAEMSAMPIPEACAPLQSSCPALVAVLSGGLRGTASTSADGGTGDASTVAEANDPDPLLCGGAYRSPCAIGKYCAYLDGCGTAGHCRPHEQTCTTQSPVCGCDGQTRPSECAAAAAGIGLAHEGPCLSATEQFPCGDFVCDGASYCLDATANRSDPDQQRFVCLPLPDGCATCTCADALSAACYVGARCTEQNGHVEITCE